MLSIMGIVSKARSAPCSITPHGQDSPFGHIFTELASASHPNIRPIFADMLRRLQRGEANAILTCDVSRLSRNFHDSALIDDMLARGTLKQVRTPTDTVTSKLSLNAYAIINECERNALSQAIKRGLAYRKMLKLKM